jgi:drug/metabolite transporter (DMT)-like permease
MALGMTFVAFCGIFLVLVPGELRIEWNSLWGLASGTTAAIAIIFLSLARQQNDTDTVLFIMFGSGTVLLYIFFWKYIHIPNQVQLFYLVLCASMGVMGQYLLTLGFRYVTAVKGGIISLFRILLAAFLGPYITSDPAIEMSGWIGALLILGANIYFIARKSSDN